MDNKQAKQVKTLSMLRWAAVIPGLIMYNVALKAFGYNWALTLSFLAVMGFCYICSKERRMILFESIVDDIKKELAKAETLIAGTAAQSPINMGKGAAEVALKILRGEEYEKEAYEEVFMINAENVSLYGIDGWQ